jgi:hypothetical protein
MGGWCFSAVASGRFFACAWVFNFTAAQKGPGKITLKESPPFIAKQSNGLFTYAITIE